MLPAAATLPLAIDGAIIASSVIVTSIKALYGTARCINDFLNDHIDEMIKSDNHTISRTGSVLDMAKYGFGIGYITSVVVIAAGQLILGNPLTAVVAVATSPINPIAMTCAAVGAIYYGWNVLSDVEKNEILEKISKGLEVGFELIKSIIHFIIDKTKELWSSENLVEIRKNISKAAATFGKTLADVTHKVSDMVVDTFEKFRKKTSDAVEKTGDVLSETYDVIKVQGGKAVEKLAHSKDKNADIVSQEEHEVIGDIPVNITEETKVKLTSKGQLTIPRSVREQLGLSPHTEIHLVIEGNNVTLRKVDVDGCAAIS